FNYMVLIFKDGFNNDEDFIETLNNLSTKKIVFLMKNNNYARASKKIATIYHHNECYLNNTAKKVIRKMMFNQLANGDLDDDFFTAFDTVIADITAEEKMMTNEKDKRKLKRMALTLLATLPKNKNYSMTEQTRLTLAYELLDKLMLSELFTSDANDSYSIMRHNWRSIFRKNFIEYLVQKHSENINALDLLGLLLENIERGSGLELTRRLAGTLIEKLYKENLPGLSLLLSKPFSANVIEKVPEISAYRNMIFGNYNLLVAISISTGAATLGLMVMVIAVVIALATMPVIGPGWAMFAGVIAAFVIADIPIVSLMREYVKDFSIFNILLKLFRPFLLIANSFEATEKNFWKSNDSVFIKSANYLKPEETSWFAAVIKPIAKISNDVINYAKPYRNIDDIKRYCKKVALQPIDGLQNMVVGLLKATILAPWALGVGLYHSKKNRSLSMLGNTLKMSSLQFFGGITQSIRGIWQMGSFIIPIAPLSIVTRAIFTLVRSKQNKLVDVKPQINTMIDACEKALTQRQQPSQQLVNVVNCDSRNSINVVADESSSLLASNKQNNNRITEAGACRAFQDLSRQLGDAKAKELIKTDALPVLARFGIFAKENLTKLDITTTEQLQSELKELRTMAVSS
ncbi:MAG: hypothetical protein ACK4PR_09320, partial [Gammaproteobacteria bacterium]